jgi:hypothetical protein
MADDNGRKGSENKVGTASSGAQVITYIFAEVRAAVWTWRAFEHLSLILRSGIEHP